VKYKRRKKEGKNETNKNNELDYVMMIIKRYETTENVQKTKQKPKKQKKQMKKRSSSWRRWSWGVEMLMPVVSSRKNANDFRKMRENGDRNVQSNPISCSSGQVLIGF